MRFTKLRLNGFKSFVDPTDLVIHDGLTGVVGPNGCGKSNLLEALRWVMGENRPTAMRGGGMDDVIFNGAATRTARNFAEVAREAIACGAALSIGDADDLVTQVTALLADADRRRHMGDAGRAFAERHRGATARTMDLITEAGR